jgi:hypothetical protein
MLRTQLKTHNFVGRTWRMTTVLGLEAPRVPVAPKVLAPKALVAQTVLEHGVLYRRTGFALAVTVLLLLEATLALCSSNIR